MRGLLLLAFLAIPQADPVGVNPDVPYRTDTSNEHLPWYPLKAGEFPPHDSEHRVSGELLEADFIHRSGQFRTAGSGELVDFTLLPFATVMCLNAEGDLRDVPLGTLCQFSLYQDERGHFTRVAAIQDDYSRLASQALEYRLEAVNLEVGKLDLTQRKSAEGQADLGRCQFSINEKTRIWKGGGKGKPSDLAVGDELLVNVTGSSPRESGRCIDIWVGPESRKLATEQQHRRHERFLKERGLPAWIDHVEGKKLTVTVFGDPSSLQTLCKREGIVPSQWAREHRSVDAVVANEELRSYNPPVDRRRARVLEFQPLPTDSHGGSGVRWVIEPDLLLEGFRKGRIIRLFVHPSWRLDDMPFGEGMYSEAPNVKAGSEEPLHYPYRTDFANEDLPWYQLKPVEFPPLHSHHLVVGELVRVDEAHRSGQFRADRSGELVDFTMPPFGAVKYLNTEADLADLPLGTRYLFFLHQDDRGAFTKATVIMDESTKLAEEQLTYRLDEVDIERGKLLLSRRHAPVKNEKEDWIQPPDLGWGEFAVDASTRVSKADKRIEIKDLVEGDELLVNLSGRTATNRGVCTDVWVGKDTYKLATEKQRSRFESFVKGSGLPAWIEKVEGKDLTITFFCGHRKDFTTRLNKSGRGTSASLKLVDEELRPTDVPPARFRLKNQSLDGPNVGTYGSSGVHWSIEVERLDERYRPGQIIRVFH